MAHRVVSSTFMIVQILVHMHFDLVSWFLLLEATEPVAETVTQMAVEHKHSSHFSTAKEISVKAIIFFTKKPQQTNFEIIRYKLFLN